LNTISVNTNTGKIIKTKAEVIKQSGDKNFYILELEDGRKIECSMEHKFFIKKNNQIKKIPLKRIKEKNNLICIDIIKGIEKVKIVKVKSIKFSHCEIGVDLSILNSKHHNFVCESGIVSHNSTLAQQVGFFIVWLLAGGSMAKDEESDRWFVATKPHKIMHFTVEENIVFTPEDLQTKARELYSKYGKNQVIIYDEGRAGLDSAAAMTSINKAMQDFFQECGQYGHVILIVLPNFFKLHEDYAISRSIFLVDVFTNKKMERGFFNFYNEHQKELLFLGGKKKGGSTMSKYSGSRPSFNGRFSNFLPINKGVYEQAKQDAIKQKEIGMFEKKWKRQRDSSILMLYKQGGLTIRQIATELTIISGIHISENAVRAALRAISGKEASEIKDVYTV